VNIDEMKSHAMVRSACGHASGRNTRVAHARHQRAGVPSAASRAGVAVREWGPAKKVRKDDGAFGMKYIWLIPLLPLAGAAINGLNRHPILLAPRRGRVACTMMLGALGLSLLAFLATARAAGRRARLRRRARSVDSEHPARDAARASASLRAVGFPARSAGRADDPRRHRHRHAHPCLLDGVHGRRAARGVARFFCYLNLFCFFMLMLVLATTSW